MGELKAINARVYQGARRRYFSKSQAERSYFWAALKRHCECEKPTFEYYGGLVDDGMVCDYHQGDHRDRIAELMRRFLRLHFRRTAP